MGEVDGVAIRAPTGSLIYVPAGVVHCAYATPEEVRESRAGSSPAGASA